MPATSSERAGPAPFDPSSIGPADEAFSLSYRAEALELFRLAKDAAGSVIELGSYCGYTALFLAFGIRNRPAAAQEGAELFTVDMHASLSPQHEADDELSDLRRRGMPCSWRRLTQLAKRHKVWDLLHPVIDDSARGWRHLSPGRCGMLHIDGDHDRTRRDFDLWSHFLEPGDIVTFHDYSPLFPLVVRDVDALMAEGAIRKIGQVERLFVARLERRTPPPPRGTPARDDLWARAYGLWTRHHRPFHWTAWFVRYRLLGWYKR